MIYVKVLSRERLTPGVPVVVSVRSERVMLIDLGDRVVAVDGACLRCGETIEAKAGGDGAATCPGCGWRYDLRAGRVTGVPALWLHSYPVRLSGADVYIGCPSADDGPPLRPSPGEGS